MDLRFVLRAVFLNETGLPETSRALNSTGIFGPRSPQAKGTFDQQQTNASTALKCDSHAVQTTTPQHLKRDFLQPHPVYKLTLPPS